MLCQPRFGLFSLIVGSSCNNDQSNVVRGKSGRLKADDQEKSTAYERGNLTGNPALSERSTLLRRLQWAVTSSTIHWHIGAVATDSSVTYLRAIKDPAAYPDFSERLCRLKRSPP